MSQQYPHDSIKRVDKPWGFEVTIESNKDYILKKLFMAEGESCSVQHHEKKTETIYVLKGRLRVLIYVKPGELKKIHVLYPGEHLTIQCPTVHRMEGIVDTFYLEASGPYPDDVIRHEDKYGRTDNSRV